MLSYKWGKYENDWLLTESCGSCDADVSSVGHRPIKNMYNNDKCHHSVKHVFLHRWQTSTRQNVVRWGMEMYLTLNIVGHNFSFLKFLKSVRMCLDRLHEVMQKRGLWSVSRAYRIYNAVARTLQQNLLLYSDVITRDNARLERCWSCNEIVPFNINLVPAQCSILASLHLAERCSHYVVYILFFAFSMRRDHYISVKHSTYSSRPLAMSAFIYFLYCCSVRAKTYLSTATIQKGAGHYLCETCCEIYWFFSCYVIW